MTKFFVPIILLLLVSCGSGGDKQSNTTALPVFDPVYKKGVELTEKYQCMTCHKVDETLTGPAYSDVAKKYAGGGEAIISTLSKKIIEGGAGVWGNVAMSPHPNISQAEAREMVQYILMLK